MATRLATYREKRDPERTPEPMGSLSPRRRGSTLKFVIQEHHARALHWDFRLEREGVLASWALPKGIPPDPPTNHLAVHTEDHPLDYADFEGEIPKGEYGGGKVTIWDRGSYDLEGWSEREVKVVLHGSRVRGRYVLFHTKGDNWMIHRMDPPEEELDPLPARVEPMLARAGELPVDDAGWSYEFKWDGVRAVVYAESGRVHASSRNDKELSATFPELRAVGEQLGSLSAVVDGEIVAFDDAGRPSFSRLQQRLHLGSASLVARRARSVPATYLAFDLLYLDGRSLLARPYDERRCLLESLELSSDEATTPPAFPEVRGSEVLAVATSRGLEGVIAKRLTSPYAAGQRNGDWVKVKNFRTQAVVIGGWTVGKGERRGSLSALLLGLPTEGGLSYVGKVGTGFAEAERRRLLEALAPLASDESPFATRLGRTETALSHFVRPELVGEVRYGEWTHDGRLRHPSWRGLRPDVEASGVVREP